MLVDYARSFFPVILIVLVIRSFLFEPFRIPSDSMMPTLLDGDFIFVNKFTYGLRLPVATPRSWPRRAAARRRVVFRLPSDPSTNYIKRLVGLPGDHVIVRDDASTSTASCMPVELDGMSRADGSTPFAAGRHRAARRRHTGCCTSPSAIRATSTRSCRRALFLHGRQPRQQPRQPLPGGGLSCRTTNVVGKAVRIWLNWNLPHAPIWGRIGDRSTRGTGGLQQRRQ